MPSTIENLAEIERMLRETFAAEPAGETEDLLCQQRTAEIEIQYALWIAREKNAGTSADMAARAWGACVGSCLRNFIDPWADKPEIQALMVHHFMSTFSETFNFGRSVKDHIAEQIRQNPLNS